MVIGIFLVPCKVRGMCSLDRGKVYMKHKRLFLMAINRARLFGMCLFSNKYCI